MRRIPALCRDCLTGWEGDGRCPACRSPRALRHPELRTLAIAHLDCDAFYASVEKRDDPSLRDRPVIVGGGSRGVVTTACYIARIKGVTSAMPMFRALELCPEAVVVRPRMSLYADISRSIRAMMLDLTPLVEPLSLDEAFLDLSGTERLHGAPPAVLLAGLQSRIERELGLTASVGLSHNKFLAKLASDLDKPRGFAVIGREETAGFLARQPVGRVGGVGRAAAAALEAEGIRTFADLQTRDREVLIRSFGSLGDRLWHLARGEDERSVTPDRALKSISHETTFPEDLSDLGELSRRLWSLVEQVSARAKARAIGGRVVTLKLKRSNHLVISRRETISAATCMADRIYCTALPMLRRDMHAAPFRLLGLGISELQPMSGESEFGDLLDPAAPKRLAAERAADQIRERFGPSAIALGRAFR